MKNGLDTGLKVLLTLILVMPIFGVLGFFPAPTRDLYTTNEAFTFIELLMSTGYIMVLEVITFSASIGFLWSRREALAALLLLPFTVNIVGFHAFLDGGLFTGGAVMGNVLLLLNVYFLWQNRAQYQTLLTPKKR
jgi:hypothetical protein